MLEKFTDEQITQALKDMEIQENNNMRQEFVEGLRNGRSENYTNFRIFMMLLKIEESKIPKEKITTTLQLVGWNLISKMREQIFNGVTNNAHESYISLRKFFAKLGN